MTKAASGNQHIEPLAHLVPELRELIRDKQWDVMKELLEDVSPLDLADSWYRFNNDEKLALFRLLQTHSALPLFERLSVEERAFLLKFLEESQVTSVIESAPSKEVAEVFHKLPKSAVRRMVSLVKKKEAVEKINLLLKYPQATAGAIMHPEFIKLSLRMTAEQAVKLLQSVTLPEKDRALFQALYVTSDPGELLGAINLEDLVASPPDVLLKDIMTSVEPIKVSPETDQEKVAAIFSKYNLLSAPVVNGNDRLIGVIEINDIIDVINAEASEDIAKIVGTRADEFRVQSVFRIAWFRAPWLLATLATQVVVSFVMRHFGFVLQEVIALATFLPLVAAMGGNVGAQSAVVFVRGLALGRLKGPDKYGAILREAGTGLILGLGYGLLVSGIAFVIYQGMGMRFVAVVGLSVWIAMFWAAVAGAVGPIFLEKIGLDPATAVGPMVTTMTDLFSITVYFILSVLLLNIRP